VCVSAHAHAFIYIFLINVKNFSKYLQVFITCFCAAKFSTAILDAPITNCTMPTAVLPIPNAVASSSIALFLSSKLPLILKWP